MRTAPFLGRRDSAGLRNRLGACEPARFDRTAIGSSAMLYLGMNLVGETLQMFQTAL